MKKRKAKNTNEHIGKIKIVDDFLPKPKDLVLKARLCTFWCSSFWIGMASGAILIPRIGLNTPSWELKLRLKASLPEGRVQKCTKSRKEEPTKITLSLTKSSVDVNNRNSI